MAAVVQRVFGVADEVDQDLQDFVFVHQDIWNWREFADHMDLMPFHRARVQTKGVFHQDGERSTIR